MDAVLLVVLILVAFCLVGLIVMGFIFLISQALGASVGNRREGVVLEYDLSYGSADALPAVLESVSPIMRSAGYELAFEDPTLACFLRRYRPVWLIVLAILFFPLGLLLLLWAATESLQFQVLTRDGGSRLYVSGKLGHRAHDELRTALAELGEMHSPAGWYPGESGQERYWDGEDWTDQTRPARVVVGPRMSGVPPS